MQQALQRWQADLLDLSAANRLLHFTPGKGALELTRPAPKTLFNGLVNRGRTYTVWRPEEWSHHPAGATATAAGSGSTPQPGSRPVRPLRANEVMAAGDPRHAEPLLYRLYLHSQAVLQEQGTNSLCVSFGTLDWPADAPGQARCSSPLFLAPVRLHREAPGAPYTIRPLDEELRLNPVLSLKLERELGLHLTLPDVGDHELTLPVLLDHVRRQVPEQPDWVVSSGVYLGLFSWTDHLMYQDLVGNHQRLASHPLVRLLAGERAGLPDPPSQLPTAEELDERISLADTYQVLDADASQQEAIAAVKAGANLVMQGAPGTGKSQTIVNLIAESLAQGKTVLFVSQKMAALQVAAERLRQAGLGQFCLQAHSRDQTKAALVKELAETLRPAIADHKAAPSSGAGAAPGAANGSLEASPAGPPAPREAEAAALAARRRELTAYARALHDAGTPLGLSAFQVHGLLAERSDAPPISFQLAQVGHLTRRRFDELRDLVLRLAQAGDILLRPEEHPWYGCSIRALAPQAQAELDDQLQALATAAETLAETQESLRQTWGLPAEPRDATSLASARWLHELLTLLDQGVAVPAQWLGETSIADRIREADQYGSWTAEYRRRRRLILEHYHAEIFQLDLNSVVDDLALGLDQGGPAGIDTWRADDASADQAMHLGDVLPAALDRVLVAVRAAEEAGRRVAEAIGLPPPTTLAEVRRVQVIAAQMLTDPRPLPEWFDPDYREALASLVTRARAEQATLSAAEARLGEQFDAAFLEVATEELAERFETAYASWLRTLRPDYHRHLGQLRRLLKAPGQFGYGEAVVALDQVKRRARAAAWLAEHGQTLATGLGHHYAGQHTDWDAVHQAITAVETIAHHLGGQEVPERLVSLLLGSSDGDGGEAGPDPQPAGQAQPDSDDLPAGLKALQPAVAELDAAVTEAGAGLADLQEYVSPEALTAGDEAEAPGGEDEVPGVGLDEAPLAALSARLQSWLTELQPLRRAVGLLSPHRRSPAGATGDLLAEAREALAVADLEAALLTASDVLRERFGHFYAALDTDWEQIRSALVWVTQLRGHFPGPLPAEFERIFLSGATTTSLHHPVRARFESALQEVEHLLEVLRPKLTSRTFTLGQQPVERAALAALAAWARAKRQSLPSLQEWIDYTRARGEAREAGLAGFVTQLLQERPPRDLWLRAFERQVYTLWLQQRYEQAPALAAFRRPEHEAAIKEFAALDRRFWQTAAPQIAARASQRRAAAIATTPSAPEAATLLREAGKKRGFAPWRRLFADLPTLLPALKPCLLMSPATVAEYLGESTLTFDLVIFDEASQIPTAHAIGAIGRGRQVVVAGDVRQLPPGRAGAAGVLEDDDRLVEDDRLVDEAHAMDEAQAVPEAHAAHEGAGIEAQPADRQSLLEACLAAGLPSKALRWHYRSRHEHLFAFSNRHFYERRLVTFLPPDQHEPAVELIHVEGGRADGRLPGVNRVEARRLAEMVLEQLERHPEQSLGVIALSAGQVIAIQSELEARVLTEPELAARLREAEEHGFFVKHVQDVQGDERDVILFSLGYGPDAGGRLRPDFGPLSLPTGERFLNVAVTRARRRVKVMASFHPHELDPSGASAGVRRLREYLEFAAGGPARLVEESTTGDDPSPFEAAVAEALRRRGLRVVPRVGLGPQPIDLGVKDPRSERYLLGIEGDGAAYAACQTARDRDRLRHEILESLGWTIHRVWSADWLADPAAEVERIMAALPHARQAPQRARQRTRAAGSSTSQGRKASAARAPAARRDRRPG